MIKDKDRTPVAKDVITMCTRCRMELNHVVISHNRDGVVERVKCHTCGSEHKYRSSKRKTPPKSPRSTPAGPRVKKKGYDTEYARLMEVSRGKPHMPYNISGTYREQDVIGHPTFGIGIVLNVSNQKMDVAFEDGPRLLACNRKPN